MRSKIKATRNDYKEIYTDQLNKSSSKMLYSFSKGSRFALTKADQRKGGFDPLSTSSRRATSFGHGDRSKLGFSMTNIPGPSAYKIKSQFDLKHNAGISFGDSRQKVRNRSFIQSNTNPSPFEYTPKDNNRSIKYSLGRKADLGATKKILPGPGDYQTLQLINSHGRVVLSQFKGVYGNKFSRLPRMENPQQPVPGPGKYETNQSVKILSKYSNEGCSKFTSGRQKNGGIYQERRVPGPGFYNHYTEFHSSEISS